VSVTVCREWPFKQVWFEAWPEDSERWSRGDRNGKSVPEAPAPTHRWMARLSWSGGYYLSSPKWSCLSTDSCSSQ